MKKYGVNWKLLSIIASVFPFLIIIFQFNIGLEDIFSVGIMPFILASLFIIIRLFIQGIKFNYVLVSFFGKIDNTWKIILIRIGSEFVTFTTPMFVGGEIVRIAWLKKRKVPTGKASWLIIIEIITEIMAAGIFAIISGLFALIQGSLFIGSLILFTSIPVMSIWIILFFFSSKRIFQIPNFISTIIIKFGKKKGEKYINKTNKWIKDICIISKYNLKTNKTKKTFVVAFILSFAAWSFYGVSFIFIADSINYKINVFDSILAVMASNTIGNVPITIGGSGLAELGLWAYLENYDTLDFRSSENKMLWNGIIIWRVSTYHVPISISWLLLVKLALSKYTNK
ncbi:MAG: lysylphosphatidylglycerol synthase transmembrane domain-containing protein [Thaumarchaeota archaeon]|nr:lysylphosphatidylglycerol synthase transmembrane domain-containing protein [Nitrososphaerota archaeon]